MDSNLAVVILAAGKGKRLGGASQRVREILRKANAFISFGYYRKN